ALATFALAGAHTLAWAWISARHILIGAVPATLAILAHVKAREDAWRPGAILAPLALAVGLAARESALARAGYIFAYELRNFVFEMRKAPGGGGGLARRVAGAAPVAVVVAAYLVLYRVAGGGATASGQYHDPFASPGAFAALVAVRLPVFIGDAVASVP